MNQKVVGTLEKIIDTFDEVVDACNHLKEAIQDEDEERVDEAMNMFPTPKRLSDVLEKLGKIVGDRPWETKKGKKA